MSIENGEIIMINEKKINILIVDDRPENLFTLEAIIENDDYQLVKAFSGEEALKFLLKDDFAAILLDVQMPGMDGFDTAKIIKTREKTKNIPILFITANNMESEHIFKGYSLGAIDYILKPFDPMILKAKVDGFVEIYRMKQKLIQQADELKEKNKVIEYMAYHDGLTDLPNRRMFQEQLNVRLNQAVVQKNSIGIMFLDLDRFKNINDSLGHITADRLLQEISRRLASNVREMDLVARVGGDEFMIMLPETDRETALSVAENILEAFKEPYIIDQYELYVTTCIGLSVFPYDGEDATALIKNADAALYRAKEQGKNMYNVYHSGMNIQSYRTFLMQNDLRKAIERNEFVLVYQPIVNIETGKVMRAEALLRWNHPNWGMISPLEFIPLAEEIGQIADIGIWVMNQVCAQLNSWIAKGLVPVQIGVNFSSHQFLQKNLISSMKQLITEYSMAPEMLEIEVTETAMITNDEATLLALRQLRDMGIKINLDDFGTGYSSINYLRRFPFDTLKIDKSYIQALSNNRKQAEAIINLVVTLADNMNMSVIFEGVETEEQLEILRKYSGQEYQGYLYSPPLSPTDFEKFISGKHDYPSHRMNVVKLDSNQSNQNDHNRSLHFLQTEEKGLREEIIDLAIRHIRDAYSISTRETDVFKLIINGKSNKEISEQLFISEHTVKNHITKIFQKLNVSDRVQAIAMVYETCMNEREKLIN